MNHGYNPTCYADEFHSIISGRWLSGDPSQCAVCGVRYDVGCGSLARPGKTSRFVSTASQGFYLVVDFRQEIAQFGWRDVIRVSVSYLVIARLASRWAFSYNSLKAAGSFQQLHEVGVAGGIQSSNVIYDCPQRYYLVIPVKKLISALTTSLPANLAENRALVSK